MKLELLSIFYSWFGEPVHKNIKNNKFSLSIGYVIPAVCIITLFTQNTSVAQNFFPTEINNKYQTKVFSEGVGPGGGGYQSNTFYSSFEVIKDTLIEDKRFIRFKGNYPFNQSFYFHYDEAEQKLFVKLPNNDSIRLAADFYLPAGDSIISYITGQPLVFVSAGISNVFLFDDSIPAFKMEYYTFTKRYSYTFAKDIGVSHYYSYGITGVSYWGASTLNLFSAIIDTTVYNQITLNISSIYPLINRPVNSFPFVLYGSYATNLNLVDTFYVNIDHIRDNDTISRKTFNFLNNSTNIQYSALQGGDRLMLKAYIRDKSIFINFDSFPDSGYAEILILPAITDVSEENNIYTFKLEQNYPNPFNPATTITYSIPGRSLVSLVIFDLLGNEIIRAVQEEKEAGMYTYQFNNHLLPSGVYLYRLSAGDYVAVRKLMILK